MNSFTQFTPTEIIFGKGAEDNASALIKKHGGTRVFIVYGGGSAVKSGLMGKITASLDGEGIPYRLFGGAQPNPLLSHAREGVKQAIAFNSDIILAVGGGSAIDTAKAIAHGTANPETDIWRFWKQEQPLTKSLPVGVVLTISAAGSETSNSAVITNSETAEKRGLGTDFNRPKFALMNPELTYSLPPYQIACGIVDILMHTLDRYFTRTEGNDLTTEFAEALLRVTVENGTKAAKNPGDYQPMSELMWCGSISHNGLTGLGASPDFSVHQLGHELSGMFGIAHGASLSVMWGAWANYTYNVKPERFARYAQKVWGVNENEGIEATVSYFKSLDMPTCFSETGFGVQPDAVIDELAERCTFYGKRLVGQFKQLNKEDLYNIYKLANR